VGELFKSFVGNSLEEHFLMLQMTINFLALLVEEKEGKIER
jgi:hypothetical protein